jgi:uncharacterized protein YuzE
MGKVSNLKNKIDYDTIDNIMSFKSSYDKEADSLIIQPKKPVPATSIDWDGDFWVRIDSDSGEIVGIEIEDFKEFFSKKYNMLRGHAVTSPVIKAFVIALLKLGPKPFTKKDFIADLNTACQRVEV